MQVLKAIDTIVAEGGPPGQKDQELLEVQQHLQKTRDAFTSAKKRVEEINTVQQHPQISGAENKHPNHADAASPSVRCKFPLGQSNSNSPTSTLR